MELNICCLYPELLGTYGDMGNCAVLSYRARARGITVNVENISRGDDFFADKYDIVILGSGQASALDIVYADMSGGKKQALADYIEKGGVTLAVGGGYLLLGEYYHTPDGEKKEGLGILSLHSEHMDKRITGNILIETQNEKCVGFENRTGKTYIGDMTPLGDVLSGYGNNGEDKKEGAVYKNTFCTNLHGPFLSKNPVTADKLLSLALSSKYGEAKLLPIDDEFEVLAKKAMIKKLNK